MYTLVKTVPLRQLAKTEVLPFGIAFVVAELFYKFHSFALESLAFLATWFVISWLANEIGNLLQGKSKSKTSARDGANESLN